MPFSWAVEEAEFAIWVTVMQGERLTDDTAVVLVRRRATAGTLYGAWQVPTRRASGCETPGLCPHLDVGNRDLNP